MDVAYHTYATMAAALGERMAGGNAAGIKAAVDARLLGRKTGKGFYVYDEPGAKAAKGKGAKKAAERPVNDAMLAALRGAGGGVRAVPAGVTDVELQERMVLRFAKECVHALDEGVVRSAGDGDVAAVFGLGFPPFLGGPFRWMDTLGPAAVVALMAKYEAALGPQFAPPRRLVDMAAAGTLFYPKGAAAGSGGDE